MSYKPVAVAVALVVAAGTFMAAVTRDSFVESQSCAVVMDSEVCTWVVMDGAVPVEMGASVPLTLIESVPADAEMVWPPEQLVAIALPAEARESLGIDHMAINWEAHGHPPTAFLTQHFDFHFYNISQDRVRAIDCADDSKPSSLPPRYTLPDIDVPGMGVLVGLCVPRMGMHAMLGEEVDDTDLFDASMMLGYYGGEPIFFEPMVSRDLLLEKADFSLQMPAVEGLPEGVRYPGEFRAEYDTDTEQYRLVFTAFRAD